MNRKTMQQMPELPIFSNTENKYAFRVFTDGKGDYRDHRMVYVNVALPTGDVWCIGTVIEEFDESTGENYYHYNKYYEWVHMSGFAEKQPKTVVKDRVADIMDTHARGITADDFNSTYENYMTTYGKILDAGNDDNLRETIATLAMKVDELKQENEGLRNQKNPSFDTLVMKSLVDNLAPAIEQKAQELADGIIEKGTLPVRLVVDIAHETREMEGVFNERFNDVLSLVANDIPVYLTGEAGTGKNYLGEQVADALGFEFVYMGQVMDKYTDCVGFVDANGNEHATPLVNAVRNGGVLFIDEIDASIPEVLITCNALLANGYMVTGWGERIDAHENFRVICAGNTVGTGADATYNGRYQLDGASLDRFAMVHIDYDNRVEAQIAGGDNELCRFVQLFRKAVRALRIAYPVTYRATSRIHKMDAAGMNLCDILEMCLLKSLAREERNVICSKMKDIDRGVFDTRYGIAFDGLLDK